MNKSKTMQSNTMNHTHSRFDGFIKSQLFKQLNKLQNCYLEIKDADGSYYFGDESSDLKASISVNSHEFYRAIAFHGSIGAAEQYIMNNWNACNLTNLVRVFVRNQDLLDDLEGGSAWLKNSILKIAVDKNSGKAYFATSKGIVAYNSDVAVYGDTLTEVYAYPNPSKKENDFITIDGRNGAHLPKGTNIKILDTAGNLVFETNIREGQESLGGKVVWNKTNLAGRKVASGIYIVLLIDNEKQKTSITKIAIIN